MAAQITAIVIFLAMFGLIIWDKFEHYKVTLGCGAATLVLVFGAMMRDGEALMRTLNVRSIFTTTFWHITGEGGEATSGINWATIIFIAGMMVMVEGMAKAGFFRWLCMRLAKMVNYKPLPLFITFIVIISLIISQSN